jgi:HEPN domain-containing protein
MNSLTLEWVDKAEKDLFTARREQRVRKASNDDAVCFHSQQAAEKYLKAMLQEMNLPIPRVHSLAELLALVAKKDPDLLILQPYTNIMEGYAIQFRYPGFTADKDEAKAALKAADRVCSIIKNKLGL